MLHEAPHMGDNGEGDPQHEVSQPLSVLGFGQFDLQVNFDSSNQPVFNGGL